MDELSERTAAHESSERAAADEAERGDGGLDTADDDGELDPVDLLKEWLDEVPCQPRLYPSRLYALQLLSGDMIDELIDAAFIQPLGALRQPDATNGDWLFAPETPPYRFTPELLACRPHQFPFPIYANQFASDLTVFGLREAILFLPSSPQAAQIAAVLNGAVPLYHRLARAYLDHRDALTRSDHGRIRILLASVEEGAPQQVRGWQAEQGTTIGPRRPPPRHPEIAGVLGLREEDLPPLGPTEALIEYIDGCFMFEHFPGFVDGTLEAARLMREYGVDPHDAEGQRVLSTYVAHSDGEIYGDFDRYSLCARCGREFMPALTLEAANAILAGRLLCPSCAATP